MLIFKFFFTLQVNVSVSQHNICRARMTLHVLAKMINQHQTTGMRIQKVGRFYNCILGLRSEPIQMKMYI